ncbi:MAG TPA: hypothetical protein VGF53_07930 [Pseudolabrys sp.]
MLGVGMVGYGIPINEFSFGNTLIVGGTTAVVGGLIIIAIAVAVRQLKRIGEMLATSVQPDRPVETFESVAHPQGAPTPSQIPFPPKPKSEAAIPQTQPPAEIQVEDHPAMAAAPTLRNPDRPPVAAAEFEAEAYEDVSLSPQQPAPAPVPAKADQPAPRAPINDDIFPVAGMRSEPALDTRWHSSPPPQQPLERQSQPSHFDAMWPAESRPVKRPVTEEARPEAKPAAAPAPVPEAPSEPVAILKSGVVDGMSYTLYVDGSIEAELPQGTLHFASINELRDHLARSS